MNSANIYYEVHGSGPPLLLIAGTACDGNFWQPYQVSDFSRDHTVIILDQRGIGKTTMQSVDYSTDRLAADAAALIEHVGLGPAIVVGHSLGGRVAQLVALDHPTSTKALVLNSSGAGYKAKGGIPPKICLGIIQQGYERYIREHNIEIGFTRSYGTANPERVEQLIQALLRALPPVETYLAQVNARQWHDTRHRLKDITVPCHITVGDDEVHGLSDTTHVESAKLLAEAIPNSKFEIVKDAGHFYHYSHPEVVNQMTRTFIESLGVERILCSSAMGCRIAVRQPHAGRKTPLPVFCASSSS